MTRTYNLKGMSCSGCESSVEKYLKQVENVTNVFADVQKAEVEVTMNSHIDMETLQKSLPEKYILTAKMDTQNNASKQN